jgi:small subunit ribosomal protein S17
MKGFKGKVLEGVVLSDKMNKTIVVNVVSRFMDPVYQRTTVNRKRYKVHDPKEEASVGDRVCIAETRPLSKEKRFVLLSIVKKGAGSSDTK